MVMEFKRAIEPTLSPIVTTPVPALATKDCALAVAPSILPKKLMLALELINVVMPLTVDPKIKLL